jgi:hypothetical protein
MVPSPCVVGDPRPSPDPLTRSRGRARPLTRRARAREGERCGGGSAARPSSGKVRTPSARHGQVANGNASLETGESSKCCGYLQGKRKPVHEPVHVCLDVGEVGEWLRAARDGPRVIQVGRGSPRS